MDAEFVAVRIDDDSRPAAGQVERLMGERDPMVSEVLDRAVEVVNFEREVRAITRGLEEGFFPDRESMGPNLILDPKSIRYIESHRRDEAEHTLIKRSGPYLIRGRIHNEGKFGDPHEMLSLV